jgi:hypothetical protein
VHVNKYDIFGLRHQNPETAFHFILSPSLLLGYLRGHKVKVNQSLLTLKLARQQSLGDMVKCETVRQIFMSAQYTDVCCQCLDFAVIRAIKD